MTAKATYYNKQTKETYTLAGVESLKKAWCLSKFVCNRMGWNHDMFCDDVAVNLLNN